MNQILIIDGWWGSGKSTLRGLLDGHPDLMVCPVQDALCGGFARAQGLSDIFSHRDLGEFRRVLWGLTDYNRIEKDSLLGNIFNFASGSDADYGDFEFNFLEFDRQLVTEMEKLSEWTMDEFLSLYYKTFAKHWANANVRRAAVAVSMDNNYPACMDFIRDHTSNVKYIWVDRSSEDILAVQFKRKQMDRHVGTRGWGTTSLDYFIRSGFVFRHERRRMKIETLAVEFPDRFRIAPLRDLVENTDYAMRNLAEFIGVDNHEVLNRYTYLGEPFSGSERYIGKLNDLGADVFTPKDLNRIRREVTISRKGFRSPVIQKRAIRSSIGAALRTFRGYCES